MTTNIEHIDLAHLPIGWTDYCKAWLYDIFYLAGATGNAPCKRQNPTEYYKRTAFENISNKDARRLYELIVNRPVGYKQFKEADQLLSIFKYASFCPYLNPKNDEEAESRWSFVTLTEIADVVAWFCFENKIYWDDAKLTPYERKGIVEDTELGKALAKFDCFLVSPSATAEKDNVELEEAKKKKKPTKRKSKSAKKSTGYKIRDIATYDAAFDKYRD